MSPSAREVTVVPETFTYVLYEGSRISELARELADRVGLPDGLAVRVEVDEESPLGRTSVTDLDPVTVAVEGGAFEDAKRLRHLSERSVVSVLGRHLVRARDRLDPAFGEPPPDREIPLPEYVAWDVYAIGRLARLGYPVQKDRRQYHFRIRHGFTDAADEVFERLWNADGLTWSDLQAASAEAATARDAVAG